MKRVLQRLGPTCAALGLALAATAVRGADFDYSNNKEFLRKYPDLACIDSGPLPHAEAESYTAAKLQELGKRDTVEVKRGPCFSSDGPTATEEVTETVTGAEFLDRLYARLGSGAIPHGFYDGKVILSREHGIAGAISSGSAKELGVWLPKEANVETFAQRIWAGKFFDRDRMFLKNRINLDGIAWNSAPTALTDARMKFPAKLYCGQSLFDGRRESIVIDYLYGVEDRPPGISTDPAIDWLAGPKGFQIRDEVRMVKPGLFLGRAYLKGAFGLYFVLEYHKGTGKDPSWAEKDSCWLGHQRQRQLGLSPSDYVNNFAN